MINAVNVNYWAILVSAVAAMILGFLWYSPVLFGKTWMKLMKIDEKKINNSKNKGMWKLFSVQFFAAFLMIYVLAVILKFNGSATMLDGILTGFWCWLGFIAATMIGMVLWEQKPIKLYAIITLYYLVALMIAGSILTVWR